MNPRPISLDALGRLSPWPAWLLGESQEPMPVLSNFEQRYEELLSIYRRSSPPFNSSPSFNFSDFERAYLGDWERPVAMSIGDELFEVTLDDATAISNDELDTKVYTLVASHEAGSVVDLGCGWGWLLASVVGLDVKLYGTEVSPAGERLAREIVGEYAKIYRHDLTSSDPCPALVDAEPPVVAVTSFVCHYLPSALHVVEHLTPFREKIAAVITFEPELDDFGDGLLGLLRRAYVRARGYSADTKRILQSCDDVEILETGLNTVGANALLPGSLTVWRFR